MFSAIFKPISFEDLIMMIIDILRHCECHLPLAISNILAVFILCLFPGKQVFAQDDFGEARSVMVQQQIQARGIKDQSILQAFLEVERHLFVPSDLTDHAYEDRPLPIGYGQTISQPYIVAYMTAAIEPNPTDKVLEIGTGSGYQAAILSPLVDSVFTIEIVEPLVVQSINRIRDFGFDNVQIKFGDGYFGWEQHAPFDAIIVTAAADYIPPPLIDQLKDGGKMIIPVGSPFSVQTLMEVSKVKGKVKTKSLLPVRFVPFRRK